MTRRPDESERDFLSRWSRRKQDARREPEDSPEPPAKTAPAEVEKSEAEILEELGLPDPDTLGPGSDFKAFMAEAVPDWLRRRALRRLWTSNPTLANLDMLVDYGEDYTDKATVVANLQSAYKAGRGYFDRLAPQDEPAEAEEQPTSETAAAAESDSAGPAREADEREESEDAVSEPSAAEVEEQAPETAAAAPPPRRRRMRFDFDES